MKFLFLALFFSSTSWAHLYQQKINYYGEDFYNEVLHNYEDKELKQYLFKVLTSYHRVHDDDFDEIKKYCVEDCYKHKKNSYRESRRYMFGRLDLASKRGQYFIKDVYCNYIYTNDDFKANRGIGPGKIPDPTQLNTEHTWPQSKFSRLHPLKLQKADLHALFPVHASANSARSNLNFSEVTFVTHKTCESSKKGQNNIPGDATVYFEPPDEHKGNVARASFYFSVRYQIPIDKKQEKILRRWNKVDPVDRAEKERNQQIFEFQLNRNPFVDYPQLINDITDF